MRVADVLNEAPPGLSTIAGWQGAAKSKIAGAKSRLITRLRGPEKVRIAKQNQKKWYDSVKRKQQKGVNMKDEPTYRKELYNFVSGNKKLKLDRELRRLVGQAPLTDQTILNIMTKTIDARIAAKEKQKQKAEAAAAAGAGGTA